MTDYTIHPSAIVDEGAQIGEGSRVWHFVHVCGGARIGKGVSLGQNVFVGNKVVIGDHCKIQNNVSVYDNVTLEEGVFCGPSMVFTNVYNPRSLIERKNEYRNTLVKKAPPWGPTAPSYAVSPLANTHLWAQALSSTKTCPRTPSWWAYPPARLAG